MSATMNPDPVPGAPTPDRRLLELQALDLSIDRLNARLALLQEGEELSQARDRARELEAGVGEIKMQLDETGREQSRLENDIELFSQKRDAERKRLFDGSVANAKELQSIEAEVAGIAKRIAAKEDQELEVMERREELQARLATLEGDLEEARARLREIEGTSGREVVEIEESLTQRHAERETVAGRVDEELLMLYEDVRRQKKGVAAVELVDGVCGGCHQKLSPVYLSQLKRAGGVRRCEYCRRILVAA